MAGAAASVALLTVLARLAGFGRILAFSRTVGDTCLGTAYQTANQVPNVLFEVVAGGALAGVLVPLLSSRLASDDPRRRADASRTASAALTWSVVLLVVVAGLTALLARPVMGLLLGDGSVEDCGDSLLRTGTVLLWVFLPQVPLYAVAVVFAGVLQAQQRFTAPAAAPLVSSLVVGASYLVVGGIVPAAVVRGNLDDVPARALAVLAGGTTLGVLVLALAHAPALRSAVRWRPTWRPAPGDGRRLRSLALSGLAVLLAQQVVTVGSRSPPTPSRSGRSTGGATPGRCSCCPTPCWPSPWRPPSSRGWRAPPTRAGPSSRACSPPPCARSCWSARWARGCWPPRPHRWPSSSSSAASGLGGAGT